MYKSGNHKWKLREQSHTAIEKQRGALDLASNKTFHETDHKGHTEENTEVAGCERISKLWKYMHVLQKFYKYSNQWDWGNILTIKVILRICCL